jgi:heme-degrading monooxygenase HmoA
MNRRKTLKTLAALGAGAALPAQAAGKPIQLHCDLEVDPAQEKTMVANYEKTFRPAISKQPGFVDVKLLKFRKAIMGDPPSKSFYRLIISFATEEQRVTWVAHDDHQRAWPTIEKTLKGAKLVAWLYDTV